MIGRCSCDRHAPGCYWWFLGQLTLCVKTIVLCKWFYQKGGFQLPMYALYELKIVFSKQTICYVQFTVPTPSITEMFTFPYNLRIVMWDIKTNWQKSFPYKMSIREGIVGYFHFWASVQIPLVHETFWTAEIKLVLLYFLRFRTISHSWRNNRAIFPPSVFRCAYSEKSWIFFSATTVWLIELVFLINP